MNTALIALGLTITVGVLILVKPSFTKGIRRGQFYESLLQELDSMNSAAHTAKHYWVNLTPPLADQMYALDIVSYAYYPRTDIKEPYYHDRVGNFDLYWSKPHGPAEEDSRLIIASCQYMEGVSERCMVYVPCHVNELMEFYASEISNPTQWKRICGSLLGGGNQMKGQAVRHMLMYTLCTGHVDRSEGFLII